MTLGKININLVLDEPRRTHYGSEDPIKGVVVLRYTPSLTSKSAGELFGPLQVELTLKGLLSVGHKRGMNDTLYPGQRELFVQRERIFDGSYRAEAGSEHHFPFTVSLPETATPQKKYEASAIEKSTGEWEFRRQLVDVLIENLPPTFDTREHGSAAPDHLSVLYSLSASAKLPGIAVEFVGSMANKAVLYDQPKVPAAAAVMLTEEKRSFSRHLIARSKQLEPEETKPHSLLGKTKALLKPGDLPEYAFNVSCNDVPEHLFVGQFIRFTVSIRPDHERTTSTIVPEVLLSKCTISLIAKTSGTVTESWGKQTIASSATVRIKDAEIIPSGSFHKSHDYTKTIDVGVLSQVPSTFELQDVRRSHQISIQMEFLVAGELLRLHQGLDVSVHPPLLLEDSAPGPASWSPVAAAEHQFDEPPPIDYEPLPSYGEVIAAGPSSVQATD